MSRKRRPRLRWVCSKHAMFRQSQRLILPSTPLFLKPPPEPGMHAIANLAARFHPLNPTAFIINPQLGAHSASHLTRSGLFWWFLVGRSQRHQSLGIR